jgi:hypothetical protein
MRSLRLMMSHVGAMNAMSGQRYVVTTKDGATITCATSEDLTAALVAIRRADEAMSVSPRTRRGESRSDHRPNGIEPAQGPVWSASQVQSLLASTTPSAAKMAKAAAELGQRTTIASLGKRLDTHHGAIGPMLGKLCRDAKELSPLLPVPLHTEGRPGHKVLIFDPDFLRHLKEVRN